MCDNICQSQNFCVHSDHRITTPAPAVAWAVVLMVMVLMVMLQVAPGGVSGLAREAQFGLALAK
jgi:hypothetical protein